MNRIDRISAILVQLQSKKVVKGQEIAERFNISLRTAYRDIKTLEEAAQRYRNIELKREENICLNLIEEIKEEIAKSENG